ncbi:MAG: pyridoxine 5'-phosphate synthase [Deltaproteobacteria bacterium]|nr:pyridoxine 5'-phosphate synthase [Deltaproteobacteria bacterium]
MTRLHVNIDHVATIRQQRDTRYPEPVTAAGIAELAGADGITVHLREDRRHITDRDVRLLRKVVQTTLNLEMAATEDITEVAVDVKPDIITLVPERREERTTEGGLDVAAAADAIKRTAEKARGAGIRVSLFVAPDPAVIEAAAKLGVADTVELHTGAYCDADDEDLRRSQLLALKIAAKRAEEVGFRVAAGHGLHYGNVGAVAALPAVEELNIGHAIIARAVLVGLDVAVREMIARIRAARP